VTFTIASDHAFEANFVLATLAESNEGADSAAQPNGARLVFLFL